MQALKLNSTNTAWMYSILQWSEKIWFSSRKFHLWCRMLLLVTSLSQTNTLVEYNKVLEK
jgi:hypothetical protein